MENHEEERRIEVEADDDGEWVFDDYRSESESDQSGGGVEGENDHDMIDNMDNDDGNDDVGNDDVGSAGDSDSSSSSTAVYSPPDQLLLAAHSGNMEKIKQILTDPINQIVDVNTGWTALHVAAHAGEAQVVKELLTCWGADPNVQDGMDRTALHLVIYELYVRRNDDDDDLSPYHAIVDHLLEHPKIDIEIREDMSERRRTPLHLALECKISHVAWKLLQHGMEKPQQTVARPIDRIVYATNEWTALHIAAMQGCVDIVKELLTVWGACPNIQDKNGNTALHLAVHEMKQTSDFVHQWNQIVASDEDADLSNYYAIVDQLLEHPTIDTTLQGSQSKKSEESVTPLALALKFKLHSVARKLIECGASVTNVDENWSTVLHCAVMDITHDGDVAFLKEILAHKDIDVSQVDAYGVTALHYLCSKTFNARKLIVFEDLISKGARTDARDSDENTVLHEFCKFSCDQTTNVINTLLRSSPGIVNAKNKFGYTALHEAIINWASKPALHLLEHKDTAINEKTANRDMLTPLHMAFGYYHPDVFDRIAEKLIEKGANLNEQDANGNTPLHALANSWHREWRLMKVLLRQQGIGLHTLNKRGFTFLMAAASKNAPLEFLFQILKHTGGLALDPRQIVTQRGKKTENNKKRALSVAFGQKFTM
mmetsp:Transcript_19019/g.52111  ORF Transcript_19019/g.52111 Transcript_19019/m.52111 type:complete len:656 (-) Transcript_19019:257-2224(-)